MTLEDKKMKSRWAIHEDKSNKNLESATKIIKKQDRAASSCRHSKSSAWVRSMYCVWRPYCVQL
jgi:hypothetical protein